MTLLALLPPARAALAGEGMGRMPLAKKTRTVTVTGKEDFRAMQGFGADAPMVEMMNLMMVGGSGYEGMDMDGMSGEPDPRRMAEETGAANPSPFEIQSTVSPDPPRVGANRLNLALIEKKTKKPATGLLLQAQVFMTGMDMGVDEPAVRETSPGHYEIDVAFPMGGAWAVRVRGRQQSEQAERPRVWESVLRFSVTRK